MKNKKQTFTLDYNDRNFDKRLKEIAALPCKFNDIVIKEFDGSGSDMWKRLRWINYKYSMNIDMSAIYAPGKLTASVNMMSLWCLGDGYNSTDSIVRRLPNPDKTFINIGCHDLSSYNDPCYPLALNGWGGLAIDSTSMPDDIAPTNDNVIFWRYQLTTNNVIQYIGMAGGVHHEMLNCDLLKIDIDSNDGEILRTILESGYRPKIIDIEINPEFPPPIKFSITNSINGLQDHGLYGCSCAYVDELATAHGYGFFQLSFGEISCVQDMVLIRLDVMDEMELRRKYIEVEYAKLLPVSPRHLETKSGIKTGHWSTLKQPVLFNRIKRDLKIVESNTDAELEYLLYV